MSEAARRAAGGGERTAEIVAAGNLIIVAAPSGAGKTSLVSALLAADARVGLSVSFTTRAPRPGEMQGHDYHFTSVPEFESLRDCGEFLESAAVHGNLYGTSRSQVLEQLATGRDIVLEIDWQGAAQVRQQHPAAVGIFVLPPSLATLERRLKSRASDSAEVIAGRLAAARAEIAHVAEFDYVIINHQFDDAVRDLVSIVRALRLRVGHQLDLHRKLLQQFE